MPDDQTDPVRDSAEDRVKDLDAVLFDLDGTLIDTVELIMDSFRFATRQVLGRVIPDEELARNVGIPLFRQMREIDPERADELLRVYREYNAECHDRVATVYPGTAGVLEWLRSEGFPMGVVTSKGTKMAWRGLRLFDLHDYFSVVVTADDVESHKPEPQPLLFAADALGVDVARCAYVGDSPHDMRSATAAGAVSIAALWGAFPAEEVLAPGPDFALTRVDDLPNLLSGDARRFLCK